jgi:hypothetical protein
MALSLGAEIGFVWYTGLADLAQWVFWGEAVADDGWRLRCRWRRKLGSFGIPVWRIWLSGVLWGRGGGGGQEKPRISKPRFALRVFGNPGPTKCWFKIGSERLGLFGIFCFAGCGASFAWWGGAGAALDGWPARRIRVWIFVFGRSYAGIRFQLTAGGWGWRGLAGGCCCEVIT